MMIIHGHPQKGSYSSADEWPKISHQSHWLINGEIAHMHVDLRAPLYAEVNPGDVVTCQFEITLHHFPGRVLHAFPGFDKCGGPDSIVWDATGTSTPPVMEGDPEGDRSWTGRFTVSLKPEISGWWPIQVDTAALLDDGRALFANPFMPIWANQEYNGAGLMSMHKPLINGKGGVSHIAGPDGNDDLSFVHYGQVTLQYADFLPLAGISVPWGTAPAFYSYDGRRLPASRNEVRLDLDLHNGIPGTTLLDVTQLEEQFVGAVPFDPAWGQGVHKIALIKTIEDPTKGEMLAGLLVVFPSVDLAAPPVPFNPGDVSSGGGGGNTGGGSTGEPPIDLSADCQQGDAVTTDDGAAWTLRPLSEDNEGGGSIARTILRNGVAIGGRGSQFRYRDGGALYVEGGTQGGEWYWRMPLEAGGSWRQAAGAPPVCG